jgi:hypothetical protein
MEISYGVAGMDVYKSMLAVVVSDVAREGSATGSAGGVAIVGRPVCAVFGARSVAGELILRFVPNAEQRLWRNMTRGTRQWTRDRVRLHHRVEWLLEDVQPSFEAALVDR